MGAGAVLQKEVEVSYEKASARRQVEMGLTLLENGQRTDVRSLPGSPKAERQRMSNLPSGIKLPGMGDG